MQIRSHVNFNQLEARSMVLETSAANPGSPIVGQGYFNTSVGAPRFYDGSTFSLLATDSALLGGQGSSFHLNRANHTGTQAASTISDLAAVVQAYNLNDFSAPDGSVSFNNQSLTSLADPINPQDAATRAWVEAQVQVAAAGIDSKASVRLVATSNRATTGLSDIDGVTPVAGNRILLTGNTDASENGVYIAASGAWTRATDSDDNGELTPGATWYVEEGTTYGNSTWRIENTGTIDIGTDNISINQFVGGSSYSDGNGLTLSGSTFSVVADTGISVTASGVAIDTAVVPRKFSQNIGNGSATDIAVTHNLGTLDVLVNIYEISSGEDVLADITRTNTNSITIGFASAPTTNQFRVVIQG